MFCVDFIECCSISDFPGFVARQLACWIQADILRIKANFTIIWTWNRSNTYYLLCVISARLYMFRFCKPWPFELYLSVPTHCTTSCTASIARSIRAEFDCRTSVYCFINLGSWYTLFYIVWIRQRTKPWTLTSIDRLHVIMCIFMPHLACCVIKTN